MSTRPMLSFDDTLAVLRASLAIGALTFGGVFVCYYIKRHQKL